MYCPSNSTSRNLPYRYIHIYTYMYEIKSIHLLIIAVCMRGKDLKQSVSPLGGTMEQYTEVKKE